MDYFNTDIVARHNELMTLNNWMAEHYSFCMSMPWNTDEENDELNDMKKSYLCYDV